MNKVLSFWTEFWFEVPQSMQRALGLFRLAFASLLFLMYSIRFLEFDLLFSETGLMTTEMAKRFAPLDYQPLIYWFPENTTALYFCYIIFLVMLLLLALGFLGRGLKWIVFILHIMFFQRNLATIYGADLVSNFLLFALCWTNSNAAYSLAPKTWQNWMKSDWNWLDSMGVRLIQIQMCVIYGYTGLEKLKGSEWWDGSAVWAVLMNSQLAPIDFSFLAHVPLVLVGLTWATVLFEIYFPAVIWFQKLRKPWLILGASFHLGAALTMGLPFFSAIMVSTYILFWPQAKPTAPVPR